MPAPPYYRFFVGDYVRDAGHLSLLEHGAYRRLIDLYMIGGKALPFDMPHLYRLLHATSKEEQAAVQVVVEEFFKMDGPILRHKRCDRELSWQSKLKENQSERAKIRWENERKINELHAVAIPPHSRGNAIQNQNQNHIKKKKDSPTKLTAVAPAFSLPEWVPRDAWLGWEEMRRKIRKPLTDAARMVNLRKLAKLRDRGDDPTAVIEQSLANGWGGIFEIRADRGERRALSKSELAELFPDKEKT
jgi:uncharacterized protein YdaU (DUF1376 family)